MAAQATRQSHILRDQCLPDWRHRGCPGGEVHAAGMAFDVFRVRRRGDIADHLCVFSDSGIAGLEGSARYSGHCCAADIGQGDFFA
ncbi:hypothetical protein D3C81_2048760 [compost metagenome]